MPTIALALVCMLAGCVTPLPKEESKAPSSRPGESPRATREHMLGAAWRGHSYHALVEAFGTPHAIMSAPGYHTAKTDVVVFGIRDKVSNCIDAFTVIDLGGRQGTVVDNYFCR